MTNTTQPTASPAGERESALEQAVAYERQEKERYFNLYQQVCGTAQRRLSELVHLEGKLRAALATKPPAGEQVPTDVLAAIKRAGFTLVRTAHAYHLMKFGDVVAQSTSQPHAGEQKPVAAARAQMHGAFGRQA